jgi:hypothetical protein
MKLYLILSNSTANTYKDMSRHDTILTGGKNLATGLQFSESGRMQASCSLNKPWEQIKIAKGVFQRKLSIDEPRGVK